MAIKGQKFKIYTPEFKMMVVRMHLEEGLTFSQIIKKTGVKSDAQLVDWVRKYKAGLSSRIEARSGIRRALEAWKRRMPF